MFKLITDLISLNNLMINKIRSVTAFDEAIALHKAKEYRKAFPLMIEASNLGEVKAMSILGSMYLLGQGTKENGAEAVLWLQRSIDGGYEESESVLGMALATGKAGVPIDTNRAKELLSRAAAKGDTQSARMLEMMERGEGMFRKSAKYRHKAQ